MFPALCHRFVSLRLRYPSEVVPIPVCNYNLFYFYHNRIQWPNYRDRISTCANGATCMLQDRSVLPPF
jgi:hypothetical protein